MKALSIRQPWANLIVHGIKDIENRSRRTNYRGRILVHAPIKMDSYENFHTGDRLKVLDKEFSHVFDNVLKSAIIGSVEIIDCVGGSKSVWADKYFWHWILKDPILFDKPITNVKGRLGLWNYDLPEEYKGKA